MRAIFAQGYEPVFFVPAIPATIQAVLNELPQLDVSARPEEQQRQVL